MKATELSEDGGHQPGCLAMHADLQRTAQFALHCAKLLLCGEQGVKQGLGAFIEQTAGFRHTQVTGASLQQACTESALQCCNVAADVGGRHGQKTRCAGKALLINNCRIDADGIQIECIAH
ncbi:MAG: hypothetical protein AUI84_10440 [Delftia sp. 13_1_40CM_3_66_6]|nr:MAG: hypothetical protein AUG53_12990 [Delftia sp. 13_1_20CM_4_67_18]OLE94261.1 MAG: hypothetical protein AUI84_10440 [Delftia sp. 13_1_40CM_3_66_6]